MEEAVEEAEAEAAEADAELAAEAVLAAETTEAERRGRDGWQRQKKNEANRKISLQNGINVILFPHAKAIIRTTTPLPPLPPSLSLSV